MDEKIEKLTAQQARAIVESNSRTIDEIMSSIKQASENGRKWTCVGVLSDSIAAELKELGYDIVLIGGDNVKIKW